MMKTIQSMISLMLLLSIGSSTKTTLYQGVLDRFEDKDHAVILIENLETTLIVPIHSLPLKSQKNMWFIVEFIEGTYRVASIDYKATENQVHKTSELIKSLQKK